MAPQKSQTVQKLRHSIPTRVQKTPLFIIIIFSLISSATAFLLLPQAVTAEGFLLKQTLFEGETRNYDIAGYNYSVTLISVFDSQQKAQFEVNGERTDTLSEDESFRLSDGALIQARDIMPQEAGDGRDLVQFNFFPAEHPKETMSEEMHVAEASTVHAPEPEEYAGTDAEAPQKEIRAAPHKEAVVDVTRKQPVESWWESLLSWLNNIFS